MIDETSEPGASQIGVVSPDTTPERPSRIWRAREIPGLEVREVPETETNLHPVLLDANSLSSDINMRKEGFIFRVEEGAPGYTGIRASKSNVVEVSSLMINSAGLPEWRRSRGPDDWVTVAADWGPNPPPRGSNNLTFVGPATIGARAGLVRVHLGAGPPEYYMLRASFSRDRDKMHAGRSFIKVKINEDALSKAEERFN